MGIKIPSIQAVIDLNGSSTSLELAWSGGEGYVAILVSADTIVTPDWTAALRFSPVPSISNVTKVPVGGVPDQGGNAQGFSSIYALDLPAGTLFLDVAELTAMQVTSFVLTVMAKP